MAVRRVLPLTDGTFELDMGMVVYGKSDYYGRKARGVLRSLLLDTDDGHVLVESGIGDPSAAHMKFYKLERSGTLLEGLARAGAAPSDVSVVVNTHLHFDHCGWNGSFPNARYVVQARELEYAKNPHRFQKTGYVPRLVEGVRYETVDGEAEIAPGVRVISTPGHTPGHQSVIVECDDKTYVFTGDASPCRENVERLNIPGILHDPVAALASLERLKRDFWGRPNVEWVFGHFD